MTLVASAFLVGLLGGVHCLAMCGAFLIACGAGRRSAAAAPAAGAAGIAPFGAGWMHLGRLATYAGLGAIAGGFGGGIGFGSGVTGAQTAMFVLANLTLLIIAVYTLRGVAGVPALERAGAAVAAPLQRALVAPNLTGRGPRALRSIVMGIAWGFVPCAMIYSVLALALFSGGAAAGALVMAALWAGTLPNLMAAGWILSRVRNRFRAERVRVLGGVLLFGFAVLGLYRALFAPDSAALAALCTLP